MTLAHEFLGISTVFATSVGATCGGIFNFTLGRSWVFGARHGAWWLQALRYAAVSFGCVVLNSIGMALLATRFGAHWYVAQRAGVSVMVSVLWSYPAQRWLVFGGRPDAPSSAELAESAEALDEPR